MRPYSSASCVSPPDYATPAMPTQAEEVKRLVSEVARLEHRSDCLEERIADLEDTVTNMIMLAKTLGGLT